MKPTEHFCFIRYAFFLTWCVHANNCYLHIIEHIEVAHEFITSKNPDLTRFFMVKARHPGRLKKQIWVERNAVGALHGHMRKNACYGNLEW